MGALVGVCLVAALILIAATVVWRSVRREAPLYRRFARAGVVLLGLLAFSQLHFAMKLGETSWWQCDLCGCVEGRDSCAGLLLRRLPYSDPEDRAVLEAYAAWTEPVVGDHAHAWDATLSSYRFPAVACTMLQPCHGWFHCLPTTSDQALAHRAMGAFIAADIEQRGRWRHAAYNTESQQDFERWLAATFP